MIPNNEWTRFAIDLCDNTIQRAQNLAKEFVAETANNDVSELLYAIEWRTAKLAEASEQAKCAFRIKKIIDAAADAADAYDSLEEMELQMLREAIQRRPNRSTSQIANFINDEENTAAADCVRYNGVLYSILKTARGNDKPAHYEILC